MKTTSLFPAGRRAAALVACLTAAAAFLPTVASADTTASSRFESSRRPTKPLDTSTQTDRRIIVVSGKALSRWWSLNPQPLLPVGAVERGSGHGHPAHRG